MISLFKDIKYRIEYGLLRIIIWLVRLLPLDTAVRVSAKAWRMLAPYGRRHRRALANLALAFPEKSLQEREEIALAMWGNLGRVMAETMLLDRILQQPERLKILNEHIIHQFIHQHNNKVGSLVCVSLHTGNWEFGIWPLVVAGAHPAAVYRLVKNPYVDGYLCRQRQELYPGGLLAKSGDRGHQTARLLANHVRQGGRLGLLADLHDRSGIEVPFFGHLAKSTKIPAILVRRTDAHLWAGRCIRVGNGSEFQLEVKALKVARTDDREADIVEITATIQRQFEAWVREHPEQWMWSNRRWS
jgi:KDO2-lipid IV(A) lauroyltransferase